MNQLEWPIKFVVPGDPTTKKNSQEIRYKNKKKDGGAGPSSPHIGRIPYIAQGKKYRTYADAARWYLRWSGDPIDVPVNVKVVYYRQSKRHVDLGNLLAATCDILIDSGVLADDNRNIVAAHDGSRVHYDKENPRAEIEITPLADTDYEVWETAKRSKVRVSGKKQ